MSSEKKVSRIEGSSEKKEQISKNKEGKELKKEKQETRQETIIFKSDSLKKEELKQENTKKVEEKVIKKNEIAKTEVLEQNTKNKRIIKFYTTGLITVLGVTLISSTMFALIHSTRNTIVNGVKIRNIDVSGLTYDEAKNKLNEAFKLSLDENIKLKYKDYSYIVNSDNVELSFNFQKELDEAYSVGRNGNILECNYKLLATAFLGKDLTFDYKYNEKEIDSIVDEIATSVPGLVTQYSHYIEDDNLVITPGVDGIKVEKEKLKEIIINNLKNRNPADIVNDFKEVEIEIPCTFVKADAIDMDKIYSEVYSEPKDAYYTPATETEKAKIYTDVDGVDFAISIDEAKEKLKEEATEYIVPLKRKKAAITINDIGLEAFPNKLQEFSTRYDASNWGRSENLKIATRKIDGTVLMPGQQFSFNGVVGERTVQEGYKNAAIFAGDTVVDGLAGGICQVSSTLYNAALLADLQIDERYNHSFKTSYLEVGRDATVVYGIKDFKFTNTRSYPIKIEGEAANGVVNFAIYGIEEDTEYKISIIPVITSTIPYTTQTVTDASLAPGTQKVEQGGASRI